MVFEIYTFTVSRKVKPYYVRVCIGSDPITIELDTGASLSTIGVKVIAISCLVTNCVDPMSN